MLSRLHSIYKQQEHKLVETRRVHILVGSQLHASGLNNNTCFIEGMNSCNELQETPSGENLLSLPISGSLRIFLSL